MKTAVVTITSLWCVAGCFAHFICAAALLASTSKLTAGAVTLCYIHIVDGFWNLAVIRDTLKNTIATTSPLQYCRVVYLCIALCCAISIRRPEFCPLLVTELVVLVLKTYE